jgi:hypothetical protein
VPDSSIAQRLRGGRGGEVFEGHLRQQKQEVRIKKNPSRVRSIMFIFCRRLNKIKK